MPLDPQSLPTHPDGQTVAKITPGQADYRKMSKYRDRYCGNCGWFLPEDDIDDLPDMEGDEHPEADGKGIVHRCALISGGIARGGYCELWGTVSLTPEEPQTESVRSQTRDLAKEIKRKLRIWG